VSICKCRNGCVWMFSSLYLPTTHPVLQKARRHEPQPNNNNRQSTTNPTTTQLDATTRPSFLGSCEEQWHLVTFLLFIIVVIAQVNNLRLFYMTRMMITSILISRSSSGSSSTILFYLFSHDLKTTITIDIQSFGIRIMR